MRALIITLLPFLFFCSCSQTHSNGQASFVTTLGNDTLVVERFDVKPEKVEATILMRSPGTQYIKQSLWMTPEGSFKKFTSSVYNPKDIEGKAI